MRIPVIIMGLVSMLLQITVLRLLLSTFSGNELDIGITLSCWLLFVGAGSFVGGKFGQRNTLPLSFILIALLAIPTVLAIKAIRPVLAIEPGEMISLGATLLTTAATLLPVSFLTGYQFPLAVSFWKDKGSPGNIYGLEALGASLGGILFTFVLSSRIDAMAICLIISLLCLCTASLLSKKISPLLISVVPLLLYFFFDKSADALPWKGLRVVETAESKYGEITVVQVGTQSSIFSNGQLMITYPDLQTEELKAHPPMSLHPSASKILMIGGSPGILREILKYPLDRIDYVELDPKIVEISRRLLSSGKDATVLRDPRVRILTDDGRNHIRETEHPAYDLVILNIPHPSTAGLNRFYTVEFFREAKATLHKDGILALSLPASSGYIGRHMQTANGTVYASLKSVFKYVAASTQEYGGLFASDSPVEVSPEILEDRASRQKLDTAYFHPSLFYDIFPPHGTEYVRQRLGGIRTVNTDMQPSAYLYNLMLWAEIHGNTMLSGLLLLQEGPLFAGTGLILAVISFQLIRKKRPILFFCVFTTGFSGMSFAIAMLLAYQSLYGYVYEMIGALSAVFMVGLWSGTLLAGKPRNYLGTLLMLEIMTILLAMALPFLFKTEMIFYGAIYLAGTFTGGQFSAASLAYGNTTSGGILYASDLFGSFLGAIVPSLVIIPLFGIPHALLFVAFIKLFPAIMVSSILPRRL